MSGIVEKWVEEQAALTKPDKIHWMDGTEEEVRKLVEIGIREEKIAGHPTFQPLNGAIFPGSTTQEPPDGRGEDRAPDVRLPAEKRGRRPQQQLDGAGRGASTCSAPSSTAACAAGPSTSYPI